jgi:hypothetical protein
VLIGFDARSNTFARILLLEYFCLLIASILPMLASILTRFDHWMLGHLAARSDSFTCFAADACSSYAHWLRSILARMLAMLACFDTCSLAGQLDGPSLRCLLGSFARLRHDARSAIRLDLWSFDG